MTDFVRPLASLQIGTRSIFLVPSDMTLQDEAPAENGHTYTAIQDGVRMDLTVTCPHADAFTTLLRLTNEGRTDSPRIRTVRSFDVRFPAATARFDGIAGDACGADSFVPYTRALSAEPYVMEPLGGRSSNVTAFPCFDVTVTESDGSTKTYVFGIGWTGQWHAELTCDGDTFGLSVGLADSDFYLVPGESVRLPMVLCLVGRDPLSARQAFRRLLREHFSPQAEMEEELLLPMAIQPFDRYYAGNFGTKKDPTWATEEGQMREIDALDNLPSLDSVWLDAAWFLEGFPMGVGNYSFAPGFPNGLRAVCDHAHEKGKRFILWFEPERVIRGTELAEAHPAFLLTHPDAGVTCLYNLADPEAAAYMTQLLGDMLVREGVDVFRMDSNLDPLPYWRANDGEGRCGVTEMHHVENLYRMWDDLRTRIPGLLIDNCCSGGRRLDIEALSRSVSLWRSDTGCFPERDHFATSIWNTLQIIALSRYLPYTAVGHWEHTPYDVRSTGTAGVICNYGVLNPNFDFVAAEKILSECVRIRPMWNGDFYPLTESDTRDDNWAAYALCRDGRGAVYAFRKKNAEADTFTVTLPAVDPAAQYRVTVTDERMHQVTEILRGDALHTYTFHIEGRRESLLLEYILLS